MKFVGCDCVRDFVDVLGRKQQRVDAVLLGEPRKGEARSTMMSATSLRTISSCQRNLGSLIASKDSGETSLIT